MDDVMFLKWQDTIGWRVHRRRKGEASPLMSLKKAKLPSEIEAEL